MPENPECMITADELKIKLKSKCIASFSKVEKFETSGFEHLICPAIITGVRSRGKKVIIEARNNSGEDILIITSLGMTGRYTYEQDTHSHVKFEINNCEIIGPFNIITYDFDLYFDDPRNFGKIDIILSKEEECYFKDIGPDLLRHALTEWISSEDWLKIFNPKKMGRRKIVDILLDQSLVSGIGLYIATDVLYYSGILPTRIANTITEEELEQIRINSHKVVLLSYSYGGLTIKNFISPSKNKGNYPTAIYRKTHDPNGYVVTREKMSNGRTAHFVAELQF